MSNYRLNRNATNFPTISSAISSASALLGRMLCGALRTFNALSPLSALSPLTALTDVARSTLRVVSTLSIVVSSLAFSSLGFAQTITYTVSQVSPTEYEYRYTLTNDSTAPISEFIIFFDETLYDNLSETSRPAGWDSLIVPPDLLVGSGEYDAFVTGPELAVGD
ncbi:hypothetical protein, partial [Ostreibacterium oceani]